MLRDVHAVVGWVVVVANALVGSYALAAWRWRSLRGRGLWLAVAAAQGTIALQVVLGVLMVTVEDYEQPDVHVFYGFVALITVGLMYAYRDFWRARRWLELAYGLGGLFLMGLAIRAIVELP
ncbi:MAG: hypothetical protein KatS3mg010_0506 [Acidimicrobiia bacterium]|nr:MAG: hypothetical protein KatS3mg010_0506 [Acidimicrobiia bacterium]